MPSAVCLLQVIITLATSVMCTALKLEGRSAKATGDLSSNASLAHPVTPDRAYLAICAIVKDQHLDLLEWIEWHRCLGVQRFYIYDNNSTVPLMVSLQNHIHDGTVEYSYFKGWPTPDFNNSVQWWAYHDCVKR